MGFKLSKWVGVALTVWSAGAATGLVSGLLYASAALQATNSRKLNKLGGQLGTIGAVAGAANSLIATEKIADSAWRQQLGGWNQSAGLTNQVFTEGGNVSATQAAVNGVTQSDGASQLAAARQEAGKLGASQSQVSAMRVGDTVQPNAVDGGGNIVDRSGAAKPIQGGGAAPATPGGVPMSMSEKLMGSGLLMQGIGQYQAGKAQDAANKETTRLREEELAREEEARQRLNAYFTQGNLPGVYTRYQPVTTELPPGMNVPGLIGSQMRRA